LFLYIHLRYINQLKQKDMKTFVFRVRGIKQELEFPFMSEAMARRRALIIFTERGWMDLKLSEVKISKW
jgi:hypothetical protein